MNVIYRDELAIFNYENARVRRCKVRIKHWKPGLVGLTGWMWRPNPKQPIIPVEYFPVVPPVPTSCPNQSALQMTNENWFETARA